MSWFTLDDFDPPVHVELASNITQKQLLDFRAFKDWKETLRTNLELQRTDPDHAFHSDPFVLRKIEIQSVDWFGSSRVGFVKLRASMKNSSNRELPGIAFLRGGYVAVLMILRPQDSRDERWVLMVKQPRVPAGSLSFVEIPTGMLTSVEEFDGASAREILEETGFKLRTSDLINLTELALRQSTSEGETLQNGMYLSPSGSDEYVPIFLWEKELYRQEIMDLRDKLNGIRSQGEVLELKLCDYDEVWKVCPRDAKSLAAWALYEGLNRAGVIQKELLSRERALYSLTREGQDSE